MHSSYRLLSSIMMSTLLLVGCNSTQVSSNDISIAASINRNAPAIETLTITNTSSSNINSVTISESSKLQSTINVVSGVTTCDTISMSNPLAPNGTCIYEISNSIAANGAQNINGTITITASNASGNSTNLSLTTNAITYLYGNDNSNVGAGTSSLVVDRYDGSSWNSSLTVPLSPSFGLGPISVGSDGTLFVAEGTDPYSVFYWDGSSINANSWHTAYVNNGDQLSSIAGGTITNTSFYSADTIKVKLCQNKSCSNLSTTLSAPSALALSNNNILYAGSNDGFSQFGYYTTSWHETSVPSGTNTIDAIAIPPAETSVYVIADSGTTGSQVIYYSTDKGNTWTTGPSVAYYTSIAAANNFYYAAASQTNPNVVDKYAIGGTTPTALPTADISPINSIALGPYLNISQ